VPLDELEAKLADLKYRIEVNAADMTAHGDFIRSYCAAAALDPAA
jgi:tryptophan halogenase